MAPPPGGEKKKGGCGKIILIVFLVLLGLTVIGDIIAAVSCYVCARSNQDQVRGQIPEATGALVLNTPVTGTLSPESAHCSANLMERSCLVYTFAVETEGNYQFTLTRTSGGMDPYLIVTREDGTEVGHDDDGAGYPNSLLMVTLSPGTYNVQAASLGVVMDTSEFTLTAAPGGAAPAPLTGDQPAGGQPTDQPAGGQPPTP